MPQKVRFLQNYKHISLISDKLEQYHLDLRDFATRNCLAEGWAVGRRDIGEHFEEGHIESYSWYPTETLVDTENSLFVVPQTKFSLYSTKEEVVRAMGPPDKTYYWPINATPYPNERKRHVYNANEADGEGKTFRTYLYGGRNDKPEKEYQFLVANPYKKQVIYQNKPEEDSKQFLGYEIWQYGHSNITFGQMPDCDIGLCGCGEVNFVRGWLNAGNLSLFDLKREICNSETRGEDLERCIASGFRLGMTAEQVIGLLGNPFLIRPENSARYGVVERLDIPFCSTGMDFFYDQNEIVIWSGGLVGANVPVTRIMFEPKREIKWETDWSGHNFQEDLIKKDLGLPITLNKKEGAIGFCHYEGYKEHWYDYGGEPWSRLRGETPANEVTETTEQFFSDQPEGTLEALRIQSREFTKRVKGQYISMMRLKSELARLRPLYDAEQKKKSLEAKRSAAADSTAVVSTNPGNLSKYESFLQKTASLGNVEKGRKFEIFCEELFKAMGYRVTRTGQSGDMGVDLKLYRDDPDLINSGEFFVQCKHVESVPAQVLSQTYGMVSSEQATKAIVVTTGVFSRDAIAYQKENQNHVIAIDGTKLKKLVSKYL